MDLSIIIPCFNEADNLGLLFDILDKIEENNLELLLVDNGSTDNTNEIINNYIKNNNNKYTKLISIKKNIGYGHGILTGIKHSSGEYIAWTHADLQTDIRDVLTGFKYIQKNTDLKNVFLKGKRVNRKLNEFILTFCMSIFVFIFLGKLLIDINAQPKLFHKSFLNYITNPPNDASLDLYAYYIAKINNFVICTIPVYFKDRKHGEAKGGGGGTLQTKFNLIVRTIKYIIDIKFKRNV